MPDDEAKKNWKHRPKLIHEVEEFEFNEDGEEDLKKTLKKWELT